MPLPERMTSGMYLARILADGARPHVYRAGVYRLLGVTPPNSPATSFALPLPPAAFTYQGAKPGMRVDGAPPSENVPEVESHGASDAPDARDHARPGATGSEQHALPADADHPVVRQPDRRRQRAHDEPAGDEIAAASPSTDLSTSSTPTAPDPLPHVGIDIPGQTPRRPIPPAVEAPADALPPSAASPPDGRDPSDASGSGLAAPSANPPPAPGASRRVGDVDSGAHSRTSDLKGAAATDDFSRRAGDGEHKTPGSLEAQDASASASASAAAPRNHSALETREMLGPGQRPDDVVSQVRRTLAGLAAGRKTPLPDRATPERGDPIELPAPSNAAMRPENQVERVRRAVAKLETRRTARVEQDPPAVPTAPASRPTPTSSLAPPPVVIVQRSQPSAGGVPRAFWKSSTLRSTHLRILR